MRTPLTEMIIAGLGSLRQLRHIRFSIQTATFRSADGCYGAFADGLCSAGWSLLNAVALPVYRLTLK